MRRVSRPFAQGFTLLELLIGLAVTAAVVALIFAAVGLLVLDGGLRLIKKK